MTEAPDDAQPSGSPQSAVSPQPTGWPQPVASVGISDAHRATVDPVMAAGSDVDRTADVDASGSDLLDRADRELATLDELPLSAHPQVYSDIHETLGRALTEIDSA